MSADLIRDLPSAAENAPPEGVNGRSAQRGTSLAKSAPAAPGMRRGDTPPGLRGTAFTRTVRAGAVLFSGASLMHAQPPSLAAIRAAHSAAAEAYRSQPLGTFRAAYGHVHLCLAAVAYGLLWIASSPVMTLLAVALVIVAVVAR